MCRDLRWGGKTGGSTVQSWLGVRRGRLVPSWPSRRLSLRPRTPPSMLRSRLRGPFPSSARPSAGPASRAPSRCCRQGASGGRPRPPSPHTLTGRCARRLRAARQRAHVATQAIHNVRGANNISSARPRRRPPLRGAAQSVPLAALSSAAAQRQLPAGGADGRAAAAAFGQAGTRLRPVPPADSDGRRAPNEARAGRHVGGRHSHVGGTCLPLSSLGRFHAVNRRSSLVLDTSFTLGPSAPSNTSAITVRLGTARWAAACATRRLATAPVVKTALRFAQRLRCGREHGVPGFVTRCALDWKRPAEAPLSPAAGQHTQPSTLGASCCWRSAALRSARSGPGKRRSRRLCHSLSSTTLAACSASRSCTTCQFHAQDQGSRRWLLRVAICISKSGQDGDLEEPSSAAVSQKNFNNCSKRASGRPCS